MRISYEKINDLNLKLRRNEKEIEILIEKEDELKKKSEQLNNLNRKYDNAIREKEDILREINLKNGKLDDNIKKRNILEDEIQNRENEKFEILSELRRLEKEYENSKDLNQNYSLKLEKVNFFFKFKIKFISAKPRISKRKQTCIRSHRKK